MKRTKRGPNATDLQVGESIRVHRLIAGLSQQSLADRLGVSFQQVQKYENGTNRVGAGRLPQIAEILNIPISALFSANAEASSGRAESVAPINLMPDRSALRLLTSFSRVSDRAIRRGLVDLVAAIAKAIPAKTPQGRDDTST